MIDDRENTGRPLAKRRGITISLGDHGNVSIKQSVRPNPSIFNPSENTSQPVIPSNRKDLQLPPPPTIKTTSSSTLTMNNISKHLTCQPG